VAGDNTNDGCKIDLQSYTLIDIPSPSLLREPPSPLKPPFEQQTAGGNKSIEYVAVSF
jgi:hypothetical protein